MVKKRVHELAKEFNIESRDVIIRLNQMGVVVKSHMSTIDDNDVAELRKQFAPGPAQGETKAKQPDAPRAAAPSGTAPDKRRPERQQERPVSQPGGRRGDQRRDQGPGLVDRVPSRPPDRRFQERPVKGQPQPGARPAGQQTAPAARTGGGAAPASGRPAGGQTRPDNARPQQDSAQSRQAGQQAQRPGTGTAAAPGKRPYPQGARPATGGRPPQGRPTPPQGPRPPRPDSAVKQLAAIDKAKPEKVKAQEKTKAQERAKQIEKQSFRDNSKGGKTFGDKKEANKRAPGQAQARRKGSWGQRAESRPQEKPIPVHERKPIVIQETVTVQELAEKMRVSAAEVIKKLMALGVMATINNEVDADTATLIAGEFGLQIEVKPAVDPEAILQDQEVDPAKQQLRPCVVTVMGHVDHGKTSLLDSIRETKVTDSEAGGITQHIGAYQVEYQNKLITFVDTPGHEAFTAMRARGARVTDIAVLVVAADDGVMPQTIEAINHAKAAEVPIIVAINKMDKPEANPDKIKRELTEHNLVVEDWGGDIICVEVSAKEKTGLNELLEIILLVAEMGELKAVPDQDARGTVVEAELDKGRGPVATVLVQNGTLSIGDIIIAGVAMGRVRAMVDYTGRRVKKAGPSMPVEVLGFSEVPPAGELFYAVPDEKMARNIVSRRQVKKREDDLKSAAPRVSLEDLFKHIQEGQIKELRVIIKSDVQGSTEALKQSLERLSTDEVKVNIIHGGVGAITETDIMLASASNAIIIGFNVRPDVNARRAAEVEKVDIRLYRVIYNAIEDVKAAMSGLLDPEYREVVLGRVEIRQIFRVSKVGTIAGCYVVEGKIVRDSGVRVIRGGIVVHEGKLDSLKRFKDDAKEVAQGYECGLTLEKYNELREGDIIEAFTVEAIKRELA